MAVQLDAPHSDFENAEQARRYDEWFRGKVQEALTSDKPLVPHDEAMARVAAKLNEKRTARARPSLD